VIVDAMVLAAREAQVAQRFRIANLPRLAEMIAQPNSEADLQVRFHWLNRRCSVAGRVTARLRAMCQRCLQPTELEIEDQFHVVLVKSEDEMNELPDEQDSLIADAAHLDLAWLTEEQLLLAMPLVPLHADGLCGAQHERASTPGAETKQTPFAQLRELLRDESMKKSMKNE
jgi:uncharacterized protein